MKRRNLISIIFSVLTVVLLIKAAPTHAMILHELEDNYEIRVIVPEENYEQVELRYLKEGEEIVALPKEGEVVSISIDRNDLSPLPIPFAAYQENDDFFFVIGDPDEDSLSPVIGFQSTLESTFFDKSSTLVLTAPDAVVKIVLAGDIDGEIAQEPHGCALHGPPDHACGGRGACGRGGRSALLLRRQFR